MKPAIRAAITIGFTVQVALGCGLIRQQMFLDSNEISASFRSRSFAWSMTPSDLAYSNLGDVDSVITWLQNRTDTGMVLDRHLKSYLEHESMIYRFMSDERFVAAVRVLPNFPEQKIYEAARLKYLNNSAPVVTPEGSFETNLSDPPLFQTLLVPKTVHDTLPGFQILRAKSSIWPVNSPAGAAARVARTGLKTADEFLDANGLRALVKEEVASGFQATEFRLAHFYARNLYSGAGWQLLLQCANAKIRNSNGDLVSVSWPRMTILETGLLSSQPERHVGIRNTLLWNGQNSEFDERDYDVYERSRRSVSRIEIRTSRLYSDGSASREEAFFVREAVDFFFSRFFGFARTSSSSSHSFSSFQPFGNQVHWSATGNLLEDGQPAGLSAAQRSWFASIGQENTAAPVPVDPWFFPTALRYVDSTGSMIDAKSQSDFGKSGIHFIDTSETAFQNYVYAPEAPSFLLPDKQETHDFCKNITGG